MLRLKRAEEICPNTQPKTAVLSSLLVCDLDLVLSPDWKLLQSCKVNMHTVKTFYFNITIQEFAYQVYTYKCLVCLCITSDCLIADKAPVKQHMTLLFPMQPTILSDLTPSPFFV